mgnify:FL=1|jgi:type IV secretory pathway VirB10-like protein
MKKSIVIALVGVLVVAGVGTGIYFNSTKNPKVGNAVASTEQEVAVPSADDMETKVEEVVAAKEAEIAAKKAAEEEAARVAAEQAAAEKAAKEEAEKAAKEKEQVADSNTGKGNTTAKSNKSGSTGTKNNGSTSSNGNSSNESNSTSAVTDDDNPIPGLTPGQSWDLGEAAETITDGSGGATWDIYEPIYY